MALLGAFLLVLVALTPVWDACVHYADLGDHSSEFAYLCNKDTGSTVRQDKTTMAFSGIC